MIILMFAYYVVAVLFPIDKVIGKVYPALSILLIGGTIALFIGTLAKDGNSYTTEI
ncbi:hypothetical protein FACS1894218_7220 [Bacilli bacterium]|nr:hypothetical protein FACS1894218_7220 [Bacilli bacterium]